MPRFVFPKPRGAHRGDGALLCTLLHAVSFGAGDSDRVPVPPTHTPNVTSSDLASGMPWSSSSGPKCHICPVTAEGSAHISLPSGPFPLSPR
ncbi:hypothetical protein EYF80_033903 [Liparis tanakae]|uniref:Uncharacterized protein n=1 Tax=Liparis tanakae TaxID=230148 RepID=A0A4Z2GTH8_9TELE|nr:hypothetical protein EYF80_033903 [Liparis tanakae]